MVKDNNQFKIRIVPPLIGSLLNDDIDQHILSPLSCLREFETNWLLEFDLPLVNKKDIKIILDGNSISVEAKLKETYFEEKLNVKTKFEYFKKILTLPGKIDSKKIFAKFNKGRLTITIPKVTSGHKIEIE
jgi:HSP20 family protein